MQAIREKPHRLPPEAYRGSVRAAFTINAAKGTEPLLQPKVYSLAECALQEAFAAYHGHTGVYVFMPDHLHLIVSGASVASDLLKLVSVFKQKTAYRLREARYPFAWQKDFYDHLIRAREDYGAQVRYVLRNPVRRGLCERWEDWRFKGVLGQTWEQLAAGICAS